MNYLDIVLVIPLIWGCYQGFKKGVIIEIASLVALAAGIAGAIHFSDRINVVIRERFQWHSQWTSLVAFVLLFLAIVIVIYALAKLLERIIKIAALGMVNRLLGATFGILKFGLMMSVLLFLLKSLEHKITVIPEQVKKSSLLYDPLCFPVTFILPLIHEKDFLLQRTNS